MAPNSTASLPRRKPKENQFPFQLGVRGRKTGLMLPDTGIRDENGLEPMDNLFSSPAKPKAKPSKRNSGKRNVNTTISSEEDMDVAESTIPEPEEVLERRASMRLPPPRSKSPIKTFLQSPARRNPSLGPVSSPTRGSIYAPKENTVVEPVRRRLDFSANDENGSDSSTAPKKHVVAALSNNGPTKLSRTTHLSPLKQPLSLDNRGDEQDNTAGMDESDIYNNGDSNQMINDGGDDEPEVQEESLFVREEENEVEQEEPEPEPKPQPPKKRKSPAVEVGEKKKPVKGQRERKRSAPVVIQEEDEDEDEDEEDIRPAKRNRVSPDESPELTPEPAPEPAKKKSGRHRKNAEAPRPQKRGASTSVSKPKPAARSKSALTTISEADSPEVKRGPPLPRNNRGLLILRRETPAGGVGFLQTRSGRNSIKPVAYWKNERVEYSEDENEDNYGKFLLPRIKEVVRADEVDQPSRRQRAKSKLAQSKKRKVAESSDSEDDEAAEWELEPGRVFGDIRAWDPEDQLGAMASEEEAEIALSNAAIITREVKGGSFKFAKTVTLPFFGSGMVDLPPGAVKTPKNSRKMQMVFFVHYGRVLVTVNDNEFSIGKGGMWQVPRGNFYSIANVHDRPARIFFSQGCEPDEDNDDEKPGNRK